MAEPGTRSALDRRFEAAVFDWDGTAVPDRRADATGVKDLLEDLTARGFEAAVVSGTNVENVDGQLAARPRGPGRLHLLLNRGSEVYEVAEDGPRLVDRRVASTEEERALTRAAELAVRRLADRGLRAELVAHRLNRRKIDLIPEPAWADPAKSQIVRLLAAVEQRLGEAGVGGLPEVASIAVGAARDAGLVDPRVTSDVKHVEIGLTDKSDSARWILGDLARRGIGPGLVLVAGDELGPLGGLPGSDSLLLVPEAARAVAVSVGVEPGGAPAGVVALGGGPKAFRTLLADQLRRRKEGEPPELDGDPAWTVVIDGFDPQLERVHEALLALADGRLGTRGIPLAGHRAAAPGVLISGVYEGGGAGTRLAPQPVWNRLAWDLDPARHGLRRRLDLRTGVQLQEIRTPEGTVRAALFSSLGRPGTAVLRAAGPEKHLRPLAVAVDTSEVQHARSIDRVAHYGEGSRETDFELLLSEHRTEWAGRWEDASVAIEGDRELELAARLALFHLTASVADTGEAAVGARGLTGPAYRGHVFWDADVFVLPFLAATHPRAARAMLEYRLRRLPAARELARSAGRKGARFPWESAAEGVDVTPMSARDRTGAVIAIRTGLLEEHITADVAWAAGCYADWTGDSAFTRGPGLELLVETARYWASRIRTEPDGTGHIYGVIGPDEYHEPVDDNAFTNVMARWNLRRAAAGASGWVSDDERRSWSAAAGVLVDGYMPETRLYEQFAGFFGLEPLVVAELTPRRPIAAEALLGRERVRAAQVVKQADVLMLHHLVPDEVVPGSLEPNLSFYEPRTAHGSSLSPAIHASLFARAGELGRALELLRLAARLDLDDLTGSTAGGLHLATMGGVWQALAFGFAGLRPVGQALRVDPRLPPEWDALELSVRFRGSRVRLRVEHETMDVRADAPVAILAPGAPEAVTVDREGLRLALPGSTRGEEE